MGKWEIYKIIRPFDSIGMYKDYYHVYYVDNNGNEHFRCYTIKSRMCKKHLDFIANAITTPVYFKEIGAYFYDRFERRETK